MQSEELKRQMAKTAQARFVNVLQEDFGQPPRVAQAVLLEAEDCLLGRREHLRPGQMRVVLVKRGRGTGGLYRRPRKWKWCGQ